MKATIVSSAFVFFFASAAHAQYSEIPQVPSEWPPASQLILINGTFLQHPLVTAALDHVKKTVNPTLLNLQPSQQIEFGNVVYPLAQASESAYCHWGVETQCTRKADTADFKADILTCPEPEQWGITYDDGPNGGKPGTADLRAALNAANIKATFFVLGTAIRLFPEELKVLHQDGHQIALHSWTHHPFTSLTNEQIVAELKYNEALIYSLIGQVPLFFRPPYGDIDDRVRAIVSALGYRTVIWTTLPDIIRDTQDTTANVVNAGPDAATVNITQWFTDPVSRTRGFISLQHDQNNFTAAFSIAVVNAFRVSGSPLKPQPVATCVKLPFYKLGNGTNTTNAPTETNNTKIIGTTTARSAAENAASHLVSFIAVLAAIVSLLW